MLAALGASGAQERRAGGVAVDRFAYAYDGEHLPKYEDNLLRPGQSAFYDGFDSAKRVVLFARGTLNANKDGLANPSTLPDDVRLQSLEYDGLGNWTRNVLADGGFHVEDRAHTNFNEVHAVNAAPAKAYDDNGNLLDDGTRTYRWDALNRLIQVSRKEPGGTATTIAAYLYDTQNRRVRQILSGGGLADDPATDGQRTSSSRCSHSAKVVWREPMPSVRRSDGRHGLSRVSAGSSTHKNPGRGGALYGDASDSELATCVEAES